MAGQRYDQILSIIDELKPRTIVEIGVARIVRAREMSVRAMEALGGPDHGVHYSGYDVFDTETPEFHAQAYNHKRVEPHNWCERKLWWITQPRERGGSGYPKFTWSLFVGRTKDTLHGKPVVADLAFIDGDHRADVIEQDYRALAGCKVVVFDDYYVPDERGMPDTKRFGCNSTIEAINSGRLSPDGPFSVEILPQADKGRDQGASHLVAVWRRGN